MRVHRMPASLIYLVAAAALLQPVHSSVLPNLLRSIDNLHLFHKRCDNPCGYYSQLCCSDGDTCGVDANNQAICVAGGASANSQQAAEGNWQYYTTTYVMTDLQTITTTFSSFVATETGNCQYALGESLCGSTCCTAGEFCDGSGKCKDAGSDSSAFYSSFYTVTVANTAEPPLRPTSDVLVTVTATGADGALITTTQGFIQPTGIIIEQSSGGGGGGLSAGAIAGIVIGVIAALIILILLCLCCCAKGILDSILAIFGLGSKKRKRTEEVEVYESHHRRGRSSSAAPARRTWWGSKPKKSSVVEEKKSSSWGRGASVAAFLGGLALILGLKRRRDRKDDKASSVGYGSSYYSDYTSSTESSSDRQTRRSGRSRSRAYSASRAGSRR